MPSAMMARSHFLTSICKLRRARVQLTVLTAFGRLPVEVFGTESMDVTDQFSDLHRRTLTDGKLVLLLRTNLRKHLGFNVVLRSRIL